MSIENIVYNYDQEVDILYICFSPGEKATTAVELNDNILLRLNRQERRAVGLTLMDFSVLIQPTELGPRSFPLCGHAEKLNRQGERFTCRRCGFSHDADYVGALNILSRFTGEPIVPQAIKPQLEYFSIN